VTEALWLAAVAWLLGAGVTAARLKEISSDNPGARFLVALFAWPIFWLV